LFLSVFFRGPSPTRRLFLGLGLPDGEAKAEGATEVVNDPDVSLSIDRGEGRNGVISRVPGVACKSRLLINWARSWVAAWMINVNAIMVTLLYIHTMDKKQSIKLTLIVFSMGA